MKQNETNLGPKSSKFYECKLCHYNTCKFSQYQRHIGTDKHKNRQNETNETKKVPKSSKFSSCSCGQIYNSRTSLWRHKKVCDINNSNTININVNDSIEEINKLSDKELITMLVKQNSELMSVIKNGTHNINYNTTTNNSFNINFFLNETCKNAINIQDFISSIKMSLDDLETTGRKGYIEGISNIMLKNLQNIEQCLRPIHCSDIKRESIYIKDANEWVKETENKPILTKAIKTIANENIKQITNWKKTHPECMDVDSKKNNLYLKIVSNSMCGITKEETDKNISKIISNIAKEVVIDKK